MKLFKHPTLSINTGGKIYQPGEPFPHSGEGLREGCVPYDDVEGSSLPVGEMVEANAETVAAMTREQLEALAEELEVRTSSRMKDETIRARVIEALSAELYDEAGED